jgi:hypothetical protein
MHYELDTDCAKVLLFLAAKANREHYFEFIEVCELLDIPNEKRSDVFQNIWHHNPKYVGNSPDGKLGNPKIKITEKGIRDIDLFEDIIHKERVQKFPSFCNKVLRFITRSKKTYNTKEISEELSLDYEIVEAIADKFGEMGLVDLSTTSGHDNLHVLNKAHRFVQESFFEQDGRYSSVSIGNYINAPQNKGIIQQDSISGNENEITQNQNQ